MKNIATRLQNKINNALERYNWFLNDKFTLPHPSLTFFLATLEEEGRSQGIRLENIRYRKKSRRPAYEDLTLENIPYC